MKKRFCEALVLFLALAAAAACAREQTGTALSLDVSAARWVDRTLSRMSLEEKVGQMGGVVTSRVAYGKDETDDYNRAHARPLADFKDFAVPRTAPK